MYPCPEQVARPQEAITQPWISGRDRVKPSTFLATGSERHRLRLHGARPTSRVTDGRRERVLTGRASRLSIRAASLGIRESTGRQRGKEAASSHGYVRSGSCHLWPTQRNVEVHVQCTLFVTGRAHKSFSSPRLIYFFPSLFFPSILSLFFSNSSSHHQRFSPTSANCRHTHNTLDLSGTRAGSSRTKCGTASKVCLVHHQIPHPQLLLR